MTIEKERPRNTSVTFVLILSKLITEKEIPTLIFFSRYTVLINGRDAILRDEKSLVAPNAKFDGIY